MRTHTTEKGFVYIGFDGTGRLFKIGLSKNPARRETEIKRMNPTFKILSFAEVPNMKLYETNLHKKFSSKRVIGEWFDVSPKDVSELIGNKLSSDEISIITGKPL